MLNVLSALIQLMLVAAGFIIIIIVGAIISAIPVYFLWNWLVPTVFHGPTLTFWQSWGILVLCGCLFKSHIPSK